MYKKYPIGSDETLDNPLQFEYKNWEGKVSIRTVIPMEVWYGYTDYHTTEQWMLKAYDVDKQAKRDFAMKDIIKWID